VSALCADLIEPKARRYIDSYFVLSATAALQHPDMPAGFAAQAWMALGLVDILWHSMTGLTSFAALATEVVWMPSARGETD
jgi:hypothetical protein